MSIYPKRFATSLSLIVSGLPYLTSHAFAADFQVPAGTSQKIATVNDNDNVNMTFQFGRSYCCEGWTENAIQPFTFSRVKDNAGITLPSAVARGLASPILGNGLDTSRALSRFCFTGELAPSGDDSQIARCEVDLTVPRNNVTFRTYETTLVGGFNTSVTDFNFLEITNTLNANINDDGVVSGRVIARNALTDTVVLNTTFEVNPGDRIDINLHEPAGAGVFGPLEITHDAPLGALQATVSQYRIVSTAPLDFEPVAQTVLRPAGAQ